MSCRTWLFNISLVLAMQLTLMTWFLIVPVLPALTNKFDLHPAVIAQTSTVYECGKFVGCIIFGALSVNGNMLKLVFYGMVVYAVFVAGTAAYLAETPLSGVAGIACFFIIWFAASVAAIAPQFGLSILQMTNDKLMYKRLVMGQGIVAAMLQGLSVLFGSLLSSLALETPFYVMIGVGFVFGVALFLTATTNHIRACDAKLPEKKDVGKRTHSIQGPETPLLESKRGPSYPRMIASLLFARSFRRFQAFILALGTSTATMYCYPTFAMLLYVRELGYENFISSVYVFCPFGVSMVLRFLCLFVLHKVTDRLIVIVGCVFLAVGSVAFLIVALVLPVSLPTLLVPGCVCFVGVGLVMPNCKAGAVSSVPPTYSGAATSLLKMFQLVVSGTSALIAGALFRNNAVPLSSVLVALNVPALLLFASFATRAARKPDAEAGGERVQTAKEGDVKKRGLSKLAESARADAARTASKQERTPSKLRDPTDASSMEARDGAERTRSSAAADRTSSAAARGASSGLTELPPPLLPLTPHASPAEEPRAEAPVRRLPFRGGTFRASDVTISIPNLAALIGNIGGVLDRFVTLFNTYGIALLDVAEPIRGSDHVSLGELFGNVVPHEKADAAGRLMIDPENPNSVNVANTDEPHQPHTDEAYAERASQILTMLCDVQASDGGESVFLSGTAMCESAAQGRGRAVLAPLTRPDCLTVGRTLPGRSEDVVSTLHVLSSVDAPDGRAHLRWRSRDTYVRDVREEARELYDHMDAFVGAPENQFRVKLRPGQMVILDNVAVAHGRLPYPKGQPRRMWRVNFYGDGALRERLACGLQLP